MCFTIKKDNMEHLSTVQKFVSRASYFYVEGLKGLQGNLVFWSSICFSVCLFIHNSLPLVLSVIFKVLVDQYSNRPWNVSLSKGCSINFTDIICPWDGAGSKYGTKSQRFCRFWPCCRRLHPCFTYTMCSFIFLQTVYTAVTIRCLISPAYSIYVFFLLTAIFVWTTA